LMSQGEPSLLRRVLRDRGETYLFETPTSPPTMLEGVDANHLFAGHRIEVGSKLALSNSSATRSLVLSVVSAPVNRGSSVGRPSSGLALKLEGNPQPRFDTIPLSTGGGISPEWLEPRSMPDSFPHIITTNTPIRQSLLAFWDKVVLTPAENLVLKALRFIDPDIERIAVQTGAKAYDTGPARGGFVVKRKGLDFPVPIGTMGDGMWRMLAIATFLTQCRGSVLLVDEIDTGLHYSVMTEMWRLILNAAKEFDVQVFATTHSFDCVESLAYASAGLDDVTVQRIEAGKRKAVPYDDELLRAAAEHRIEVR
jgi:hypothetical protein